MNSEANQETALIIDGSAFLYRSFYALKPMHTAEGVPVQAVFGFFRMLHKVIVQFAPNRLVVAWDSRGETVRHTLYAAYKAQRHAVPQDLMGQKDLIQEGLTEAGMVQVAQVGQEADDLMYTLIADDAGRSGRVIMVSTDKDLAQMVTDTVFLYDCFKHELLGREQITAKFGVPPERLLCLFSLLGDASDGIPGVRGIGMKGAQKVAAVYPSVAELYAQLASVEPERMRLLLEAGHKDALLSESLFRLRHCSGVVPLSECAYAPAQWAGLTPLFQRLQFKSLLKTSGVPHAQKKPSISSFAERYGVTFHRIDTEEKLRALCDEVRRVGACAIDTETTSIDVMQAQLIGISLCCAVGVAYYIPLVVPGRTHLSPERVREILRPLLEDRKITFYFHHAQFDIRVLLQFGIGPVVCAFDTMVAAHLCGNPEERIGLKFLSNYYFSEEMTSFKELLATGPYATITQVPLEQLTDYAAADAHQTWKLVSRLQKELTETHQAALYGTLEMPLVAVLIEMEQEGIIVDTAALRDIGQYVEQEIAAKVAAIRDLVGDAATGINLSAPRQIEKLLFEELKLTPRGKTASGSYSTSQAVLTELAYEHMVPQLILEYRELFKLKSTYIDALPHFVNKRTGRVHTTFSQTSTATGRLASSEPNLQNIPVDRYGTYSLRSAFKAPPGSLFLSVDYSQIELRILAYLSQDEALLDAFRNNADIHAATAAHLFGVPLAEVTEVQRRLGKRINFSILYGLTAYGLSRELRIPMKEAKQYIETYFARYPRVSAWMASVIAATRENGFTTTVWGRRRPVPGIYEKNRHLYDLACRIAINTVAQGTAAEIVKKGMITLDQFLKKSFPRARLVLQIHDELLISVPHEEREAVERAVVEILEQVVDWNVPLRVTTRFGPDWGAVTK